MTPTLLVKAVAAEVSEAVKNYRMKAEGVEKTPVTVYEQHIPDEEFKKDAYYPLVIVSWQGTADTDDGSEATIGLTFGVYGEEKDAWKDLLSIMERVRQRLLIFRKLQNRYRIKLPTKFETIENQPYPFWFGYGTVPYQMGTPNEAMAESWNKIMEEDNSNE